MAVVGVEPGAVARVLGVAVEAPSESRARRGSTLLAATASCDVPTSVALCFSRSITIDMEPVVRLQSISFSSSAIS